MFIKVYQLFFLSFLMLGTLIAVSSNSWFTCWVGLEVNLMSLIPLILSELKFKSTEASIKYFLAQALASILLISMSCIITIKNNFYPMENFNLIIFLSLAVKAGLAPFHMWFPQVMNYVSWFKCALILMWQKIAPFILMSFFCNKNFVIFLMIISAVVGAGGGLNQTENKLLLTYSSIAHSSWMLMMSSVSMIYWMFYFLIYSLILSSILITFFVMSFLKITEINSMKISTTSKNIMAMTILSLGGLPPLLGFSAKLMAIIAGLKFYPLLVMLILITSSLFSLFFYTKMFYSILTSSSSEKKISSLSLKSKFKFLVLSLMGNFVISLLVLLT